MENLDNKVYIVTGASKGFGLEICRALLAAGAKVGLIARGQASLDDAIKALDAGDRAMAVAAAVDDRDALVAAVDAIVSNFGQLDGMINNAGIARPSSIATMSVEDISSQLSINIAGTIFGCQAAIPHLSGDNPRIINISSASAKHFDEMAHLSVYAASKAAVERLSRDMRIELADQNIGVTVIRPGSAATDFASGFDGEKLIEGIKAWSAYGPYMYQGMDVTHLAESVRWCLTMPRGVAVDLLEIRPNMRGDKIVL